MRRYTDEQLSRILGEHDAGTMEQGGWDGWFPSGAWGCLQVLCCANQAAFNEPGALQAAAMLPGAAKWFDANYEPDLTPEQLLHALEREARR